MTDDANRVSWAKINDLFEHDLRGQAKASAGGKWAKGIAPDPEKREKDDFYPTPPHAVEDLLAREKFEGPIWEPPCGEGHISKVLEKAGYEVLSTDLIDRGYGTGGVDFLLDVQPRARSIITNAPFKMANDFVERAVLFVPKSAFLFRLAFLEGQERGPLFTGRWGLARVWVYSARLTMWRRGEKPPASSGGMIAFAWFVFDRSHKGPPELGWI